MGQPSEDKIYNIHVSFSQSVFNVSEKNTNAKIQTKRFIILTDSLLPRKLYTNAKEIKEKSSLLRNTTTTELTLGIHSSIFGNAKFDSRSNERQNGGFRASRWKAAFCLAK